jgi:hypothetical protein
MSAKAVVVTPLEAVAVICRDKFVAQKIALTRMESLICELHNYPRAERAERAEPCPSSLGSSLAEPSRASTRLGPELGNLRSALLFPEPS